MNSHRIYLALIPWVLFTVLVEHAGLQAAALLALAAAATADWIARYGRAIAGAIDTTQGNLVFNWLVPIALIAWAAKRTAAARDEAPSAAAAAA